MRYWPKCERFRKESDPSEAAGLAVNLNTEARQMVSAAGSVKMNGWIWSLCAGYRKMSLQSPPWMRS